MASDEELTALTTRFGDAAASLWNLVDVLGGGDREYQEIMQCWDDLRADNERLRAVVRAVADGRVIFGHVVTMEGIDAPNYVQWMTQARALLASEREGSADDDEWLVSRGRHQG